MFNWFKSAISKLFSLLRKGAEAFIAKYAQKAKLVLEDRFAHYIVNDVPLHSWRDEAWSAINKTFNIDGKIPGNWITLLLSFAYELIQAQKKSK
jgi:hypothetical protein